ncbi:MAG: hypothetical protein HYY50_02440 [Candidatus Kerfeldbacteria bacterium]|nr:hypothetical protein [Candidatus Kerfeldbacteria bacterium]
MMTKLPRILLWLSLAWWVGIGAVVVDHNAAVRGSTTLRWKNPTRPTPHFAWHSRPTVKHGLVQIPPATQRSFSVTLPRGFKTGRLVISDFTAGTPRQARLNGQSRRVNNVMAEVDNSSGVLDFSWAQLVARGHSFEFTITNLNQQDSLPIRSITVSAQR